MWDALIITPFVNAILYIYHLVGNNFGIAIILFTILIRVITHPLMVKQIKGSQSMQKLQSDKRYQEIQKKYKDDKEKLAQEQMKLYKELGISPFAACLPSIIQFPLIIGLYQSITRALAATPIELLDLTQRVYPGFLKITDLVPLNSRFLWMDLGQPERLNIPGLPFGIPLLAIVVIVTTYMQSKLMATPTTGPGDQAASMTKAMNLYMPLLMGWLALTLASGLSIYFVVSNILGIAQYAMLGKVNWRNLFPGTPSAIQPATPSKGSAGKKS